MKYAPRVAPLTVAILLATVGVCFAAEASNVSADPTKAYITLAVLGGAAILFFTEIIPLPITAMLVPVALSTFEVLPAAKAFSEFGNQWVVIFMAMFIVGESTFITGFAGKVGAWTVRTAGSSEPRLLLLSMLVIGILSAFLSNTGTIAVAIPMILGMCVKSGVAPGKILMPVAFASSLGGTITLVGTPPNGIINSVIGKMGATAGLHPFAFFEFAKFGILLLLVGILYYALIGRRFLPKDKACKEFDGQDEVRTVQRPEKMWWSVGVFVFVVAAMATGFLPLVTAAMLGVCLVVITGCMTMKECYRAVDWRTIFLFAGMLPMSSALDSSGAAAFIAETVVSRVSDPMALMTVVCALTMLVTNFMSNTATAALMAPLALPIAIAGGVSPLPLLMGVAMSASACFLTPIATPPNTIVLGPGNYNFMDYLKAGWPLQVISLVMCVVVIPMIWPF
ncbi:MAG: SLC13/DASS family transporter [Desulfovibrionaceae bacterium]|jgi:anion transporter|nr:SLC13/DASS family transporter [Desulfovibrionaceae bacterium]